MFFSTHCRFVNWCLV